MPYTVAEELKIYFSDIRMIFGTEEWELLKQNIASANVYATGTGNYEGVCGVGGIIGNLGVKTTAKMSGVFSWSESLKANKTNPTNYASGAIIGNIGYNVNLSCGFIFSWVCGI